MNKKYKITFSEAELDVIENALDMQIEMCTDNCDSAFEESHKETTDKAKIVWNKLQRLQKRGFMQFYNIKQKYLPKERV